MKKYLFIAITVASLLSGCAKVPMATYEEDMQAKKFEAPKGNNSGLYIYRNSIVGTMLKKTLKIDNKIIGESVPNMYFYKQIPAGKHIVATESEFSDNTIQINTERGKNYCLRNYIKLGVFVGGANLEKIELEKCKKVIQGLKRAADFR